MKNCHLGEKFFHPGGKISCLNSALCINVMTFHVCENIPTTLYSCIYLIFRVDKKIWTAPLLLKLENLEIDITIPKFVSDKSEQLLKKKIFQFFVLSFCPPFWASRSPNRL